MALLIRPGVLRGYLILPVAGVTDARVGDLLPEEISYIVRNVLVLVQYPIAIGKGFRPCFSHTVTG